MVRISVRFRRVNGLGLWFRAGKRIRVSVRFKRVKGFGLSG